jgi:uncharacterized membrane-anchored protein
MNKLGQAQLFAIVFALIGAVMGFIMAKSMGAGLFIRMITVLCCAGAGYFIPMAAGR